MGSGLVVNRPREAEFLGVGPDREVDALVALVAEEAGRLAPAGGELGLPGVEQIVNVRSSDITIDNWLTLAKRIIPCLDVTGGRVVKGVNFVELRDAGDPVEIAERYDAEGADELTFLDITASHEERDTIVRLAEHDAVEFVRYPTASLQMRGTGAMIAFGVYPKLMLDRVNPATDRVAA